VWVRKVGSHARLTIPIGIVKQKKMVPKRWPAGVLATHDLSWLERSAQIFGRDPHCKIHLFGTSTNIGKILKNKGRGGTTIIFLAYPGSLKKVLYY
jgi:hypothetical protein